MPRVVLGCAILIHCCEPRTWVPSLSEMLLGPLSMGWHTKQGLNAVSTAFSWLVFQAYLETASLFSLFLPFERFDFETK